MEVGNELGEVEGFIVQLVHCFHLFEFGADGVYAGSQVVVVDGVDHEGGNGDG